jgi:1-deoxy-D-xylulose-5-phosphate reductoisomerase
MKRIAVLGSTGSIGRQTLQVVETRPEEFKIVALAAKENDSLMLEQVRRFKPTVAALLSDTRAQRLKSSLGDDTGTTVLSGEDGIIKCITESGCDLVVNGMVGMAGLIPTLGALEAGKDVALANKETLVAGGQLVMDRAARKGLKIIPVDSEHSAIFQCIGNTPISQVNRLLLTASGGPFRGKIPSQLKNVTPTEALAHPNWRMGKKISIDSATLMNKGLEVIEARWLFGLDAERIEVVIHPQSIVHSMVEMVDGAVLAQLGNPDMRIPIQYALTYPERKPSGLPRYNPILAGSLEFFKPDTDSFPALNLAYHALEAGGTMAAVLNGANEVAVDLFLRGVIPFNSIPAVVERVMEKHNNHKNPCLEDIIYWDIWSRQQAADMVERDGDKYWHQQ